MILFGNFTIAQGTCVVTGPSSTTVGSNHNIDITDCSVCQSGNSPNFWSITVPTGGSITIAGHGTYTAGYHQVYDNNDIDVTFNAGSASDYEFGWEWGSSSGVPTCLGGGISTTLFVTVPICSPPTPNGSGGNANLCSGGTFTFPGRTCSSGTLRWYENSSGTGTFYTGATVNPSSTTTYYPFCYTSCLGSAGTNATATVVSAPSAPTGVSVNPNPICTGDNTDLSANCATGTVLWNNSPGCNSTIFSGSPYNVSPASSRSYYVECELGSNPIGCRSSSCTTVPVTVTTAPSPPAAISGGGNVCSGSSVTLSTSCASGTVQWFVSACGAVGISSGNSITFTAPGSTNTYYARCYDVTNPASCQTSSCVSTAVTPVSSPNPPTGLAGSPNDGCSSYASNLSGNCTGAGVLRWYTSPAATGPGIPMPATVNASNTTFYAKCYDNTFPVGCQYSAVDSLSLGLTMPVNVTISGAANICISSTSTYTASHAPGSWFIASGGASASINAVSGVLSSTATPGSVTIGFSHTNGPCLDTGYLTINVIASPMVSLNDTSACFGNGIQLVPSIGGGTYTVVSGPGTVSPSGYFSSASVGVTRVAYAITGGGCIGNDTANVTIHPIPFWPSGLTTSNDTICAGGTTVLAGNCTASTIVWFDNNNASGTPLFAGNNYPATPAQTDTIYAFCYDSITMCYSAFSDSIDIVVEKCTDTVIKLMASDGCGDTTTLTTANIPGSPNFISTCVGDSLTANGDTIHFINDSTFYVVPSSLPYTMDSACIIMCNTTLPLCDTTIMYWIPDSTMPPVAPPIITCIDDTVYIGASGSVTISPAQVASVSYGCILASTTTLSQATFTCSDTGINTIWVYASNIFGGIDSCQANVTVWDTIPPSPICQNINAYLDAFGNVTISASDVDGGTNDNCGILNLSVTPNTFSCADIGNNIVTLIATDVNGNIDSCIATINVIDSINPSISCSAATFYIGASGNVSIDTAGIVNNVNDNCLVDSVWVKDSDTSLTCLNVGSYVVAVYVKDVSGNIDSCQSTLTVLDTLLPMAICKDTSIYLDASGQFSIDSSYIDNGSYSTCSNLSMSLSQTNFTCADIGVNYVTLTVTDGMSRSSSCVANITVIDTISPILTCPGNQAISTDSLCDYIIPDYSGIINANDNCGSGSLVVTQSPLPGTIINVTTNGGLHLTQPISITITDPASNSTTCSFDLDLTCNIDLVIPQFISPNGDGFNDQWVINFIEYYPNSSVRIFNRWGAIVYAMNNYDNSWDGSPNQGYKNNIEVEDASLPSSTYFYILDKGNGDDPYTGYLFIRR